MYPSVNLGFAQKHDVICTRGGVFCTRVVLYALAKCDQKGDMCTRVWILHSFRARDNQNAGPSVKYALVQGGTDDGRVHSRIIIIRTISCFGTDAVALRRAIKAAPEIATQEGGDAA